MKNIALLFILVFSLNSSFAQEKAEKSGYFSASQLLAAFPESKGIQEQVENLAKEKQEVGTTLETELNNKIKQFESEKDKMAAILKETRIDEINRLDAKIKEYYATARKEIDEKRQELLEPLFVKINEAIKTVAKKNNYTSIMDLDSGSQFLLYIDESRNILELMKKELKLE